MTMTRLSDEAVDALLRGVEVNPTKSTPKPRPQSHIFIDHKNTTEEVKPMTTGIPITDLDKETIKKLGLEAETALAKLPPIPPKPAGKTTVLAVYYDANREQILADVKKLGIPLTMKRWGMKTNALRRLTVRQRKMPGAGKKTRPAAPAAPAKLLATVNNNGGHPAGTVLNLPPLPDFNSAWPAEIQVCWFDIYLLVLKQVAPHA